MNGTDRPGPSGSMSIVDDILGRLNFIDRLEGLLMALRFGDYRSASKHGVLGYAGEVASSLAGANTFRFALLRSGRHSLNEVEALLKRYGVPIFGRTHDATCMYFSVKRRQARWAEYVMLQAGVELANAAFDNRNPGYVGTHAPGYMPAPWSERPRAGTSVPNPDHGRQRSYGDGGNSPTSQEGTQVSAQSPAARASGGGGWTERFMDAVDRLAGIR